MNAPYASIQPAHVTVSFETKGKLYQVRALPDGQVMYGVNDSIVEALPKSPGTKTLLGVYWANADLIGDYLTHPTNEGFWQLKGVLERGVQRPGGKKRHGREPEWYESQGKWVLELGKKGFAHVMPNEKLGGWYCRVYDADGNLKHEGIPQGELKHAKEWARMYMDVPAGRHLTSALHARHSQRWGGGKRRKAPLMPPHGRKRSPRKKPLKPQSVKRRWREYDAHVREAARNAGAASKPLTGAAAKLLLELGAALKK